MTPTTTDPPPVRVLSTGAPRIGVSRCAAAWQESTGRPVTVDFVTAPVLRERVAAGATEADVLICPVAVLDALAAVGQAVPGIRAAVGAVRTGAVVRTGAPAPDISTAEALKAALLAADSVVYNAATSGRYIAAMIERLGIAEAIGQKTVLVPNGAAVVAHLAESPAKTAIGFAQVTEILRLADRGVTLVGPLPGALDNVTTYAAGVAAGAADPNGAQAFVAFLATADARVLRVASGLALDG